MACLEAVARPAHASGRRSCSNAAHGYRAPCRSSASSIPGAQQHPTATQVVAAHRRGSSSDCRWSACHAVVLQAKTVSARTCHCAVARGVPRAFLCSTLSVMTTSPRSRHLEQRTTTSSSLYARATRTSYRRPLLFHKNHQDVHHHRQDAVHHHHQAEVRCPALRLHRHRCNQQEEMGRQSPADRLLRQCSFLLRRLLQ